MRTFAQKPKKTGATTSDKSTITSRSHFWKNPNVNSIFHLQRTIGNQTVQRLLQSKTEDLEQGSLTSTSSLDAPDFSRIPVHANRHAKIQPAREPIMVQMQGLGQGGSQSRRARITQQDFNPSVTIRAAGADEHNVHVGEAGEISLQLQLARSSRGCYSPRVMITVRNLTGTSHFLVDYIDIGRNRTLFSRTVNVPVGAIVILLSAIGSISGSCDGNPVVAQGRLEISGR